MQRIINIFASIFFTGLLVYLGLVAWASRGDPYVVAGFIILLLFADAVVAFTIFISNRSPQVKMSWILITLLIPYFGIILFFVFGISPLTKKNREQFLKSQERFTQLENFTFTKSFTDDSSRGLVTAAFEYSYKTSNRPVYANNEVTILTEGLQFQEEVLKAVRSAKRFIHVQYYIVNRGGFFDHLAEELIAKAKEGVEVRFLYDWVGCLLKIDHKNVRSMKRAGVIVAVFNHSLNPVQGGSNFRAHRKVLIIDNELAITGGCNVGDEYLSKDWKFGYWRDTNLVIRGEAVNTLSILFASDWAIYTKHSIRREQKSVLVDKASRYFAMAPGGSDALCQVIDSGPDHSEKPIKDLLLRLIGSAKHRIWITTPYLLPTPDLIAALRTASFAGVDVRIITPGRPDNKRMVLAMTREQQYELLTAGVKFYEFQSFIHAKSALFDDELTIIGTFNLDFRSFFINFELAVMVGSKKINEQMSAVFERDFSNSKYIDLNNYNKRSLFYRKFGIGVLSLFYPLL